MSKRSASSERKRMGSGDKKPLLEKIFEMMDSEYKMVDSKHKMKPAIYIPGDEEYADTMARRLSNYRAAARARNPCWFWRENYPAHYETSLTSVPEHRELEEGEVRL